MDYHFQYRNTAFDLWQLSLYYIYGSLVGMCNLIFTAAMILLTVKYWGDAGGAVRVFLLLACILFPVLQPLGVYMKARAQARAVTEPVEIDFDDSGLHVKSGTQSSKLPWSAVKKISKKPNMIIIFANTTHGFVLNHKTLGTQKDAFYAYAVSKIGG